MSSSLLLSPLPESTSAILLFVYAIPIATALHSLSSIGDTGVHIALRSAFYFSVIAILISTASTASSYYIPTHIRTRTSILSFILWVLMAAAFSVASFFYNDKLGYGMAIGGAVFLLLVLALCLHLADVLNTPQNIDSEFFEPAAMILLLRGLTFAFSVLGIVALITVPVISVVGSDQCRCIVSVAALHLLVFIAWFLLSLVLAATSKEGA